MATKVYSDRVQSIIAAIALLSKHDTRRLVSWLVDNQQSPLHETCRKLCDSVEYWHNKAWESLNLSDRYAQGGCDALEALWEWRNVKPRNHERDTEIVRLRDVEKKTWGEIHLVVKRKWPSSERGTRLSVATVKSAYRGLKQRIAKK
jgi:hypothetical protein